MNEALLDLLACPTCQMALALEDPRRDAGARITEGRLRCECGCTYPIRAGIPRLLPGDAEVGVREDGGTARHFEKEFTVFAEGDADTVAPEVDDFHFFSRSGLDPRLYREFDDPFLTSIPPGSYRPDGSTLAGAVVLDAGSGPGRFTRAAARNSRHVVGLELGGHVERAAASCKDMLNVDFVQGSVLRPPFRPEAFDYVFSLGVLHHTPDPRGACLMLGRLVKPGGRMSVWVYPPEYWNGRIRGWFGRRLHRRLAQRAPEDTFRIVERYLYPLGRAQAFLAKRRWTKLAGAPLYLLSVPRHPKRELMLTTIFDYYGPPIISTHTYEEVAGWLSDAGLTPTFKVPVPSAWLATRATATAGT
ncbi:MAG TPA: methyltransferase domain-containing protein [Acidimicrobiales bacterium]|nr:methyltransferase domain-containing protein [Acidimicrobiales bacterium]